jgi:hypothetical protein
MTTHVSLQYLSGEKIEMLRFGPAGRIIFVLNFVDNFRCLDLLLEMNSHKYTG